MLLGGDDAFQYFWMIVLIRKLYRRRGGRLGILKIFLQGNSRDR